MLPDLARQLADQLGKIDQTAKLENRFSHLGVVEIVGSGVWSPGYIDAHFAELEGILARIRQEFGLARVLVNLSAAGAQPASVAERIAFWTKRIYRDVDRVAILVDSDPVCKQMKANSMIATFDVFISEVAARLWLYQR